MATTEKCPAADLLVHRLRQWGVGTVFGYPGGQLTPVYDALARLGGIRHVLARHEQAAAFMADGFARATGKPGVCLAVCGPGVYNAATPLAAAHTDSVPVLLISGQVPRAGLGLRTGYYHENDQLAAARSFTKAQFRCEEPGRIAAALDSAWAATTEGRPGPVLLEIPVDVLRENVDRDLPALPPLPPAKAPDPAAAERAARLLATWKRPLILAGGGVISAGAGSLLAAAAERLGAPVFHTTNGKGALPPNHPLFVGMPWRRVTSDASNMAEQFSPLFREADGLLLVGCRLTQLASGSWALSLPASRVQIDVDADELGRHAPVDVPVQGDARLALQALLDALPPDNRPCWTSFERTSTGWRLPGIDVLGPLRRVLPADAILSVDVTRLAYVLMAEYPLETPRTFLHPAGAVAMGYGLPAALGARAAFPDRKVLAVAGDGGFQMSAMELASAVQENLPVVVLLVNDSCLTLIKATQDNRYEGRHIAVALRNPDFAAFTRSFGARYWLANDDNELERALAEALDANVPAVVEVRPAQA